MNRTCPNCGYPLHRDNHPLLGIIRFCRKSCISRWLTDRGVKHSMFDTFMVDRRNHHTV